MALFEAEIPDLVIDALHRQGDAQDYYRLNHVTLENKAGLLALIKAWLGTISVDLTLKKETGLTPLSRCTKKLSARLNYLRSRSRHPSCHRKGCPGRRHCPSRHRN